MSFESDHYKPIGKVLDAHGLKGELKVLLFSSSMEWHSELVEVVIEDKTYAVENIKPNKNLWIFKLSNIDSRTLAEPLKGHLIQGLKSLFQTEEGEEPYLSELLNFKVFNDSKIVGEVVGFSETPAHFNLVLKAADGFFEIPYVDHFLEEVDRTGLSIYMNFPEDLLSEDYKLKDTSTVL